MFILVFLLLLKNWKQRQHGRSKVYCSSCKTTHGGVAGKKCSLLFNLRVSQTPQSPPPCIYPDLKITADQAQAMASQLMARDSPPTASSNPSSQPSAQDPILSELQKKIHQDWLSRTTGSQRQARVIKSNVRIWETRGGSTKIVKSKSGCVK